MVEDEFRKEIMQQELQNFNVSQPLQLGAFLRQIGKRMRSRSVEMPLFRDRFGKLLSSAQDVAEAAVAAYKEIYVDKSDPKRATDFTCFFDCHDAPGDLRHITQVTEEQVARGLDACGPDTAPGHNRCVYSAYKVLRDLCIPIFTKYINYMIRRPKSEWIHWAVGLLRLLVKASGSLSIIDTRPITLQNTDFKWAEQVLVLLLAPLHNSQIHHSETAYLKGR